MNTSHVAKQPSGVTNTWGHSALREDWHLFPDWLYSSTAHSQAQKSSPAEKKEMFPCFTGVLPEEGYVPAKSKASFLTLSVPTPFPSDQNDLWFSRVRLDLEPRLGLWGVGWVEAWQLVFLSWCHPGTQGKGTLGTWACARCKDARMGIPKGFEFSWWWKNITMITKLLQIN